MKNIIIAYSPLHIYLAQIISENLTGSIVLYTPKHLSGYIESKKIIQKNFYHGGSGDFFFKKILFFILNSILIKRINCENLYICNDADPYIMHLEKRSNYTNLVYIEEGVTLFSRLQHDKNQKTFKSKSGFFKKILGIEENNVCLSSNKIKKAYVFFPEKLSFYRPDIYFIDLFQLIKESNLKFSFEIGPEFTQPDILIATSPLTENGHCADNCEVDIIKDVCKKNSSLRIILKLHYRDSREKYNEILNKYKNVSILPDSLNVLPYQIIHSEINPKSIYAFHSSILFSTPDHRKDFRRVSMINKVDTDRGKFFYIGLKSIQHEINNFSFLK